MEVAGQAEIDADGLGVSDVQIAVGLGGKAGMHPAAETAVCLYVVPCGLPESDRVSDSPPLKLTLRVLRDGTVIDTLERRVNQFGGDQLIGKRYK